MWLFNMARRVTQIENDVRLLQTDVRDLRVKVDEMYPITKQVDDIFNFVVLIRSLMKWAGIVCGGLTAIGGLIAVVQGWIPTL